MYLVHSAAARSAAVRLVCAVFLLLLIGTDHVVSAQTATGTITGTVSDTQGAAMAGANVTVRSTATGVERAYPSNQAGIYTAPLLPPGDYDVTATQTGFATVQRMGVALRVGQTIRIDIEMPLATQQSLVTVTAETPILETEKTEHAQNISEMLVSNLPISSRRWEQFVLLTPGLTQDGTSGAISFHGISSLYNNNSVDGANNNSWINGTARGGTQDGYVYSASSIREFQVKSSAFGVDVGQAAGGAVNAVTKSGTSALHGEGFYNMRNPALNAYDPVSKTNAAEQNQTATQAVKQQHQFGGSVGGPLVAEKLFFFTTYDGYRKISPFISTTQISNIGSLACPTAIGGNNSPRCQAAKNFVLTQLIGTFPQSIRQDIELIKLDNQLTPAHHLSGVVNVRDWKQPTDSLTASGATSFLQNRFVIGTWTAVLSTTMVNEFRYQYGTDNNFTQSKGTPPQVQVTNFFTYHPGSSLNGFTNEVRHQISDNFSFTKGAHGFKAGVDFNHVHYDRRSGTPMPGRYTYGTAAGVIDGCPTSGNGLLFCDWLVDLYGVSGGASDTRPIGKHWTTYSQLLDSRCPTNEVNGCGGTDAATFIDYAGYIQDTWKVRPNVTLNLGVRYDVQIPLTKLKANTLTPMLAKYTSKFNTDRGGIQPRIGVAWNFAQKNVVRAGVGVFYAKTVGATFNHINRSNGIREATITCSPTTTTAICAPLRFPNVLFLQQVAAPAAPFPEALTPIVLNPTASNSGLLPGGGIDPEALRPRSYQGELAFERELPGNMNFSASYIFTRGVKIPGHWDVNMASPSLTKTYDILDAANAVQQTITVPFFTQRIEPTVGPMLVEFSQINSRYNALILTFRKPMSHGVEVLANYTLSKATDDGAPFASLGQVGTFLEGQQILNPYDRRESEGYSGSHNPHRFTASVVWMPDFGRNAPGAVLRTLLSGWSFGSAITASTGTRYSALVSSTAIQCSTRGTAPSCAAPGLSGLDGGMLASMLQNVSVPASGRVAFLPRADFALPSYANVDLRAAKRFPIRERINFELRGEMFNLFNSTIIQAVNTNAYNYSQPTSGNTRMVPLSSFQKPTTTTSNLIGARQVQFGARLTF